MEADEKIRPLVITRIFKSFIIVITIILVFFDILSCLSENIIAKDESFFTFSENKINFCDELIDSSDLEFIKEAIAATESQSGQFKPSDTIIFQKSWSQVNEYTDAAGRYQFVRKARISVANYLNEPEPDFNEFLEDRKMQDRYLIALLEANHQHFKEPIKLYNSKGDSVIAEYSYSAYEKFEGKFINGYYISKSGMILMSQALGAQGTINWLMSGCKPSKLPEGAPIADRRLSINLF
jgi:hypothetical protein